MTRKTMTVLTLVLLMTALLSVSAGASGFRDVPDDAYYAPAVAWALENGVTTGTSATTFSPSDTCTRGQVVTFLWRASSSPDPETADCPFADIAPGSYYEKAVLWAVEYGITNGTSATTFSPDALCTSAHILTFLYRALGESQPVMTDGLPAEARDAYYAQPWAWAESNHMMRDMEDFFEIEAPCSRAMTVTWLYRASRGWDPDVVQRQVVADEGAVCGIYYAGSPGGGNGLGGLLAGLEEDFPFLSGIPETNIVRTEGGQDVFLISPRSPEAKVSVYRWVIDENGGAEGKAGDLLYLSGRGQPVVLCCNVSDIMPDTVVIVEGPVSEGGRTVIFHPSLSLKNGRVCTGTVPELGDRFSSGKFCDLTPYPADGSLAAPTGIRWERDDSMKPAAGGIKAVWDAVPSAEEYIVKFYVRFPQDEGWRLSEYDDPDSTEASWFGQDYYMIRLDVCAASSKGIGPVTSVIMTEEELAPILMGH